MGLVCVTIGLAALVSIVAMRDRLIFAMRAGGMVPAFYANARRCVNGLAIDCGAKAS